MIIQEQYQAALAKFKTAIYTNVHSGTGTGLEALSIKETLQGGQHVMEHNCSHHREKNRIHEFGHTTCTMLAGTWDGDRNGTGLMGMHMSGLRDDYTNMKHRVCLHDFGGAVGGGSGNSSHNNSTRVMLLLTPGGLE
jgi:hypothetical protein